MNKLNLILRGLSCASLLLTGSSVVYNASQPTVGVSIEQAVAESTNNPNIEVTDNGHGTVTTEVKPGDSHYTEPGEQENCSSSVSTIPDNSQPVVTTNSAQSSTTAYTAPTYRYTNIHDFEQAYVGWCPQDVPADAFHLPLRKYATLGYIGSYSGYQDFETAVIYSWTLIEGGFGGRTIDIFLQRWTNLTTYIIQVDPATRAVNWVYKGNAPQPNGPSDSIRIQLDGIVTQFRNRMAQLDQQFYAKCGY